MLPTDLFQVCNMLTIGLGGNIIQRIERNQFKNCQDLITVGTCSIVSQEFWTDLQAERLRRPWKD